MHRVDSGAAKSDCNFCPRRLVRSHVDRYRCPNGLPPCLGGKFPKKLTIRTGETTQFPKPQPEGDLRDSRLVRAARQKKSPGLMQTKNPKVLYRRQSVAPLECGPKSSLRCADLSRTASAKASYSVKLRRVIFQVPRSSKGRNQQAL